MTLLEVVTLPVVPTSKLDDWLDELDTQPGSSCSVTLESSGGSEPSDIAPGDDDELEEEIRKTLISLEDESEKSDDCDDSDRLPRATDVQPQARPTGCPVDPCRIVVSAACRRIMTPRSLTLPSIPEEEPTYVPQARPLWWDKILHCIGLDLDSIEETSQTTPVPEKALGMRRNATATDLAALGASAPESHTLGIF
jgi:hypothetical protein